MALTGADAARPDPCSMVARSRVAAAWARAWRT